MTRLHLVFVASMVGFILFGHVPLLKATNVTSEGIKFPDGSLQTTASSPLTTPGGAIIYSNYIHLNLTKNQTVETAILTVPQGQTFVFTDFMWRNLNGFGYLKYHFKRNQTIVTPNFSDTTLSFSSGIPFQSGTTFNLSTTYIPYEGAGDTEDFYILISGYYIASN